MRSRVSRGLAALAPRCASDGRSTMSDLEQRLDRRPDRGRPGRAAASAWPTRPAAAGPAPAPHPRSPVAAAVARSRVGRARPRCVATRRRRRRPTRGAGRSRTTATTDRTPSRSARRLPLGELARRHRAGARHLGVRQPQRLVRRRRRARRPRIQRPGTVSETIAVHPGVDATASRFQEIDNARRLRVAGRRPDRRRLAGGERTSAAAASAASWSMVAAPRPTRWPGRPRLDAGDRSGGRPQRLPGRRRRRPGRVPGRRAVGLPVRRARRSSSRARR